MYILLSILVKVRNAFLKRITQLPPVAMLWFILWSVFRVCKVSFCQGPLKPGMNSDC